MECLEVPNRLISFTSQGSNTAKLKIEKTIMKATAIKISDLKIGQILKEGRHIVEVAFVYKTSFDVQYISGALFTYRQEDLDSGKIETYIG